MVEISAIAGALASLKAAKDIAQAMIGLRDAKAFQAKMIEFQSAILDAQNSAFAANEERTALVQRVRDLEAQVAKLEAWEAQKQRYELSEIGTGTFAYVIKPSMRGTEPTHCICSDCYERGQKSILQFKSDVYGSVTLRCPQCKTDLFTDVDHPGYPLKREYAEDPAARERAQLESCPICRDGKLEVKAVKPHPIFGDIGGVQLRSLQCDSPTCNHKEERDFDPRKDAR